MLRERGPLVSSLIGALAGLAAVAAGWIGGLLFLADVPPEAAAEWAAAMGLFVLVEAGLGLVVGLLVGRSRANPRYLGRVALVIALVGSLVISVEQSILVMSGPMVFLFSAWMGSTGSAVPTKGADVKNGHPHSTHTRVCPWWFVRSFDNPLRRLFQRPERILDGLVHPGDACVDIGCGIGYFTIPMARLVGPTGSVTAVDLQPQMLAGVERRARSSGLLDRVRLHRATASGLHLESTFDFALAFWMAHEVSDQPALLQGSYEALRPGGRMLLAEPKGHVNSAAFERTIELAQKVGFVAGAAPKVSFSRAALLTRPAAADA